MTKPPALPLLLVGVVLGVVLAFGWHFARLPARSLPTPAATAAPLSDVADTTAGEEPVWPSDAPTPEQVLYAQPRLLDAAIAHLTPQTPDKVDLYLVAFAGDGTENVFRNEAEYAAHLFATRFDATGHTLVLENNPTTVTITPLATWSNLETALTAIHARMDPREDILALYLTSHGSEDHYLTVDLPPLPLDAIGAEDLASILTTQPFAYKVVIVNACFSGGFIPPLAGVGTLVITAARTDRTSFGCGAESDITWFGDAFLVHGLNTGASFVTAFDSARQQVAAWELRDKIEASEPQISVGAGIRTQLDLWRASFTPGPAVPFTPAATTP